MPAVAEKSMPWPDVPITRLPETVKSVVAPPALILLLISYQADPWYISIILSFMFPMVQSPLATLKTMLPVLFLTLISCPLDPAVNIKISPEVPPLIVFKSSFAAPPSFNS